MNWTATSTLLVGISERSRETWRQTPTEHQIPLTHPYRNAVGAVHSSWLEHTSSINGELGPRQRQRLRRQMHGITIQHRGQIMNDHRGTGSTDCGLHGLARHRRSIVNQEATLEKR